MRKLVVSSGNENKILEIKKLLEGLDLEVVSKDELGFKDFDVVEDKETLAENSRKKAIELSKLMDYIVIADDSGIFVDYLDGAPGVYSARYSGEHGNDKQNNEKLLKELDGVELKDRTAAFKTVITLVMENKEIYELEGICEGHIGFEEVGDMGFGYDPLFTPIGYDKTFGELSLDLKNTISHRYKAILKLREVLEKVL